MYAMFVIFTNGLQILGFQHSDVYEFYRVYLTKRKKVPNKIPIKVNKIKENKQLQPVSELPPH
jgi:hypothetical protein